MRIYLHGRRLSRVDLHETSHHRRTATPPPEFGGDQASLVFLVFLGVLKVTLVPSREEMVLKFNRIKQKQKLKLNLFFFHTSFRLWYGLVRC